MPAIIEEVRGRVVGEFTYPYRFFTRDGKPITKKVMFFTGDDEAVEWFKANYPDHFKRGAEMRRYD